MLAWVPHDNHCLDHDDVVDAHASARWEKKCAHEPLQVPLQCAVTGHRGCLEPRGARAEKREREINRCALKALCMRPRLPSHGLTRGRRAAHKRQPRYKARGARRPARGCQARGRARPSALGGSAAPTAAVAAGARRSEPETSQAQALAWGGSICRVTAPVRDLQHDLSAICPSLLLSIISLQDYSCRNS